MLNIGILRIIRTDGDVEVYGCTLDDAPEIFANILALRGDAERPLSWTWTEAPPSRIFPSCRDHSPWGGGWSGGHWTID